jgi:ubiquinone/menaquinone biosynthesis C-methylase UbiE
MGKDRHLRGEMRDFAMKDYERLTRWKFKWLATFYDLFDLTFLLDKTRNPRYALTRNIPNEPLRILDVCVGTANSSIVIAEANDQNEIVGIDLSPDMIAKAKNKIRRRGIRNMSIHKMDAASMSFPGGLLAVPTASCRECASGGRKARYAFSTENEGKANSEILLQFVAEATFP